LLGGVEHALAQLVVAVDDREYTRTARPLPQQRRCADGCVAHDRWLAASPVKVRLWDAPVKVTGVPLKETRCGTAGLLPGVAFAERAMTQLVAHRIVDALATSSLRQRLARPRDLPLAQARQHIMQRLSGNNPPSAPPPPQALSA